MSRIKPVQPIIHTPSFPEHEIRGAQLYIKLKDLGLRIPFGMLDNKYYYTDLEHWGKLLYDLTFKSSLYVNDKFDCDNYALKAMTLCTERYGLNAFGMVVGDTELGRHAYNIFYSGEFMLFEPNAGFPFSGSAFNLDGFDYESEFVLL